MAIERWIWSNANQMDPDVQEYQVRLCDAGLQKYRDQLIALSNRMAAVTKRQGDRTVQRCWFAGYLDQKIYIVALAGEQNSLLGTRYQGSRGLFCMMALGFTGENVCHYTRDEGLFNPLKDLLKEVNETGTCGEGISGTALADTCRTYMDSSTNTTIVGGWDNITKSTPQVDDTLWRQSLSRPVMIGILSVDDAQKLLNSFPTGAATVVENVSMHYEPRNSDSVASQWKKREEEQRIRDQQEAQRLRLLREETERLKQEREEREQHVQNIVPESHSLSPKVLLGLIVVCIILFWLLKGRR